MNGEKISSRFYDHARTGFSIHSCAAAISDRENRCTRSKPDQSASNAALTASTAARLADAPVSQKLSRQSNYFRRDSVEALAPRCRVHLKSSGHRPLWNSLRNSTMKILHYKTVFHGAQVITWKKYDVEVCPGADWQLATRIFWGDS